jgi:hypothetical protein
VAFHAHQELRVLSSDRRQVLACLGGGGFRLRDLLLDALAAPRDARHRQLQSG